MKRQSGTPSNSKDPLSKTLPSRSGWEASVVESLAKLPSCERPRPWALESPSHGVTATATTLWLTLEAACCGCRSSLHIDFVVEEARDITSGPAAVPHPTARTKSTSWSHT